MKKILKKISVIFLVTQRCFYFLMKLWLVVFQGEENQGNVCSGKKLVLNASILPAIVTKLLSLKISKD